MKNQWCRIMLKSLQGIVVSLVLFFVIIGLVTLLLLHTPLREAGMPYYVLAAACISCFLGGLQLSAIIGKRGLFIGMLTGGVVFLCLLLICMWVGTGGFVMHVFRPIQLLGLLFGGIGGIIGANIKK